MASSIKFSLIIFFFFFFFFCSLLLHGTTLAEVVCEDLPVNLCSFAIASSGKRCVLENDVNEQGALDYTCTSSEVVVQILAGYIETDRCVNACGVNRESVGISSDAFLNPHFTFSLCSPDCFRNCPNIVDMYFNLAAGEGVFLPALCEKHKSNPHRAMFELLSSGGSRSSNDDSIAPSPSPAAF